MMGSYVMPHMRKAFETHKLDCFCDTPDVKVFDLRRPGTRNMCVQLAFTPEGIHLTGDLSLGRDQSGIGTVLHKSLGWFSGELSEGYLCSKFLTKQFQQEEAVENARFTADHYAEMVNDPTWEDEREQNKELAGKWLAFAVALERCDDDASALQCANEHYYEMDDPDAFEGLGYDYPRADAGWLCIIQQTFARLYAEQQEKT